MGHVKITRERARSGLVRGLQEHPYHPPASDAAAASDAVATASETTTRSAKHLVVDRALIVTDTYLKRGSSDAIGHCPGEWTNTQGC